jgi:CheY-like chemotaxis protein
MIHPTLLEAPILRSCDIQMAEMDGHEAAERVKNSPGGDCPLIVAVTNPVVSGDLKRAMDTAPFVRQTAQFLPGKGGTP